MVADDVQPPQGNGLAQAFPVGRRTVCVNANATSYSKGRISPTAPIQKGDSRKRPPQDYMTIRIPKRPKFLSAVSQTKSSVEVALPPPSTFRSASSDTKQFQHVVNKHGLSTKPNYGEAYLFFQVGNSEVLRCALLLKRCISSSDCIQGRT